MVALATCALLLGACGDDGGRTIALDAAPGGADAAQIARIEATLTDNIELLGSVVFGDNTTTLVAFTDEEGESCLAAF